MDRARLTTSSPNRLLTDIGFWLTQKGFVFIVLLSLATTGFLFVLTYPDSDHPLAKLSLLIYPIVFWGIWLAARAIAKIEIEHAIATDVEEKASDELSQIKGKQKSRIALDRIEEDFLPHNPNTSMIRLFQHILKEAKDRKFDSSVNIMQPYREESIGDLLKLQTIQKIALQLGILGTFIGLILALKELDFSGEIIKIEVFEPLFGSLNICFGTSIAGLEVAVILGFLIMLVRRKQEAFFQIMENSTVTMISLASNAINKDDFYTEFTQIRNAVSQLSERVSDQTLALERQTRDIEKGLGKLATAKSDLDGFLGRISNEQGKFIEEMSSVYDVLSPTKISTELQASLTHAVDSISNTFSVNLTSALGGFAELNRQTTKEREQFIEEMNRVHDVLSPNRISTELRNALTDAINSISDTFTSALGGFAELNRQTTKEREQFIEEMKRVHDVLSPNRISTELQNALTGTINSISNGFETNLTPALEKLAELNTPLLALNQALEKVEAQLREQMKWIEERKKEADQIQLQRSPASQKMNELQAQLLNQINTSIQTMSKELQESLVHMVIDISKSLQSDLDGVSSSRDGLEERRSAVEENSQSNDEVVTPLSDEKKQSPHHAENGIFERLKQWFNEPWT